MYSGLLLVYGSYLMQTQRQYGRGRSGAERSGGGAATEHSGAGICCILYPIPSWIRVSLYISIDVTLVVKQASNTAAVIASWM